MIPRDRRVVVTGMGIWSCIGTDLKTVVESLRRGRSGIGLSEERREYGYQSILTGIVPDVQLKGILDRRTRIGYSQQAEYAYMSSVEAFENAGIDQDFIDNHDIGVIFGNDSAAYEVIESSKVMDRHHDTMLIGSGSVFKTMNSSVSMNLASTFGLQGINLTVSAACASGTHAIGMAYMMIRQGMQNLILAGGAQETNKYAFYPFDAISAFSMRMDDPQRASRPFDTSRDGLVPSGGAASLVIEEYEHAVSRGANILAEIVGYGVSSNGRGGMQQPNVEGIARAIGNALADAGINSSDVDYINAHATSTPQGDMVEAIALDRIFGAKRPWISSTKSMTGHECWMAGASEAVYSILMMQNGFVAPNINYETPDEHSAKLRIATAPIETRIDTVLSNSFGFGGTNSAILLRHP